VLSQPQIDQFERDGLLVLDLQLEETLLDRAISGVEPYYDHVEGAAGMLTGVVSIPRGGLTVLCVRPTVVFSKKG